MNLAPRASLLSYQLRGTVAVITFKNIPGTASWGTKWDEHRVNPPLLQEMNPLLDQALKEAGGLVLTGEGSFFSNGLDLNFADTAPNECNQLVTDANALLARLLTFPLPTCGALNGHTCALGAMIALSLDYRLMGNAGVFFIPGVELGLRYTPGMLALMTAKTSTIVHRDMILFGKRYRPEGLLRERIIDEICAGSVVDRSVQLLNSLGNRGTCEDLEFAKKALYEDAFRKLSDETLIDMKLQERRSFGVSGATAFQAKLSSPR